MAIESPNKISLNSTSISSPEQVNWTCSIPGLHFPSEGFTPLFHLITSKTSTLSNLEIITENQFLYHQDAKVSDSPWPKAVVKDRVQFSCFSLVLLQKNLSTCSSLSWSSLPARLEAHRRHFSEEKHKNRKTTKCRSHTYQLLLTFFGYSLIAIFWL